MRSWRLKQSQMMTQWMAMAFVRQLLPLRLQDLRQVVQVLQRAEVICNQADKEKVILLLR